MREKQEPQPEPTCPECGHLVSEHKADGIEFGGCIRCCCGHTPADLKPAEPQAGMMPLIESGDTQKTIFTPDYHTGFKVGVMRQRDADMAWHKEQVQQVRKAFAETIISEITLGHFDNDSGDLLEPELIAHIRAMAEKE